MSTSELHVVLGAGPAGRAIVDELRRLGLPTRLVSRSWTAVDDPAVDVVVADVRDQSATATAIAGAAVVYHAVNVPYHRQTAEMPIIADAVIGAAAEHDSSLVVLDTLYPYGTADGAHITEESPWKATSRKGMMRAELDRRYLAAHEAGTVRVSLGRAADFFGPRVFASTLGATFFPAAIHGDPVVAFGNIDLPHSYSYVPDVAAGLVTLGRQHGASGRVWHLPTVAAVSTRTIHQIVAEILGRPVAVDVIAEPTPVGPFDSQFMNEYAEMFYQHLIAQNMVSTAFEATFDQRPTPLKDALQSTLDWFAHL
ncbi:NAD-dependent epimerase/dehydratase family protein [Williamsia sp.]|uniref:NAD-dependent epimerase/dehydratase family protein n=1 Tax=Williamsia sp. TaxID=1872085 RepID=UPI001A33F3EE|nr:NAD-dependent epimerase/dehydratase family protein [Williamsia sp.]MBJ7291539.1 NAD-dependent epimerase/dehydratase family protein [Williamsia sp.]